MKRKRIFTLLIFWMAFAGISASAHAQGYINNSKKKALKKLNAWKEKSPLIHAEITGSDSTLHYSVRDAAVQNLDVILVFDNSGKCVAEKTILSCDSCYRKFLNNTIAEKYYRWTKISEYMYLARYPYRLILSTQTNQPYSFEIRRSDLDPELYRKMVKDAKEKNL